MLLRWAMSIGALGLFAGSGAIAAGTPATAPSSASAEAIFAAFTVNLTRFITWPDSALQPADAPVIIGTFPRDPINRELDAAIAGEVVNGHPLQTLRLRNLDDVRRCHVVFVSRGISNLSSVMARIGTRPILTVSDAENFLSLGGHVLFVPKPPHISLQISASNLRASGLEARAQLLRIASSP